MSALPPPSLPVAERDRRYTLLRERLRERGVDCAVVGGTNVFYLTNGVPGQRHAVLPVEPLPATVAVHDRNMVDLPPDALEDIQDWVQDIRPGNDASPLIDRLHELRVEGGVIGLTDSTKGYGGLSHGIYARLAAAFPSARFVDVSDVFTAVRAIKSDEEIALIERANRVLDVAVHVVCERVRPGMPAARVVHEGTRAMWEAGGDLDSTLGFSCWPVPKRNHMLQNLSLRRTIEPGDVGILTGTARYGGYIGHNDQVICFGPPKPLHREMFEAVLAVRRAVLSGVRPEATQRQLVAIYGEACEQTGFRPSSQSQFHQYGLDQTEHPGPAFAPPSSAADTTLHPGMVYSIAPALRAREGEDTIIAGASLVVTEDGYRELGDRPIELLSVEL